MSHISWTPDLELTVLRTDFALCRAALHLQLTTELVTAAAGADSAAALVSMWEHAGATALQQAIVCSSELLTVLSDCDAELVTGERRAWPPYSCDATENLQTPLEFSTKRASHSRLDVCRDSNSRCTCEALTP